jgi:hypothetical protein
MPDYRVYMPCSRTWVDPFDLDPANITINDIARKLSRIFRFGGASPITVAQHCVMVAAFVDHEHKPYALLHDAYEALTFDCPRPVKRNTAFILGGETVSYNEIEDRMLARILKRFGLMSVIPPGVAYADDRACQLEYDALMRGGYAKDFSADPEAPDLAMQNFITEWHLVRNRRGVAV